MDGSNGMSDAEMRLITVNGQTIMLEGDFENINITNEFLNEMVMVSNSKVDIGHECNVQADENSCINSEKEAREETSNKVQISIRGENNELEMVQIGVEEAKALGLCLQEYKSDELSGSLNCTPNDLVETSSIDGKIGDRSESEAQGVKLHSVPLVDVDCIEKESNAVFFVDDVTKSTENSHIDLEAYPFNIEPKAEQEDKQFQEDSADGLPAIGHLEGFQIPTSEDKLLLPATVNAKMVDGSYQTITLVPQVVNGAVTYTVHFSNLSKEILDKNMRTLNGVKDTGDVFDEVNDINKEQLNSSEITSVEEFLSSVQLIKSNQFKKVIGIEDGEEDDDNNGNNNNNSGEEVNNDECENSDRSNFKMSLSGFPNSFSDESRTNSVSCNGVKNSEVSINFTHQNQLAIDAKIDNLISENENVISRCKKVKYGKKVKSSETDPNLENTTSETLKSNASKSKRVKLKGKSLKFSGSSELDKRKQKLSLLKPNAESKVFDAYNGRGSDVEKTFSATQMPHMNLNGRLEYPNLRAIDDASSLPYLRVKSAQATKQPYFNVLPYPKSKAIPAQKQILPLNCDLQQAKNLISLQKFLETQKLQLKIQPLASNGNKIINIRPKPAANGEIHLGMDSHQVTNKFQEKHIISDVSGKEVKGQQSESASKSLQNQVSVKGLFNNGKLNNLKVLRPHSPKIVEEDAGKQAPIECSNKLNGIFIKNNPEYFSQKAKEQKEEEHPLGSSENPIQLVQTGHTFHSRQPLSEAQLQQIASILQKQKFDSPSIKKNSIFDPKTNTRIVYRVVYPEDVDFKDADKGSIDCVNKKKRGRHKTKFGGAEDEVQKKPLHIARGPGRPKKSVVSVIEEDILEEDIEDTLPKKKIPRTRSGRLSRPPRYMVKDYKRLHNTESLEKTCNSSYESDEICPPYQNGELNGRTDNLSNLEIDSHLLPGLRPQPRSKRNFKPEYRCPTCQKIYLGHTRMMWHLNKFPDHCNVEKYKENFSGKSTETKVRRAPRRLNVCDVRNKVKQVLNSMAKDELISFCGPLLADALTTWDFLLLRVNLLKNNRKDEVDALIQELILLLEKLTKVAEDIFLPVFTKESEKDEDCVEIDRMEVAIALGLPVGFYKVNNDNLNLLRYPLVKPDQDPLESSDTLDATDRAKTGPVEDVKSVEKKANSWKEPEDETGNKDNSDSYWLEGKREDSTEWNESEEPVQTLSTKFEPNLSSKLLESSNDDSLDDVKYEETVPLMNLDTNSKDVEQSNSSGTLVESPDITLDKNEEKIGELSPRPTVQLDEEKPSLWTENSRDKDSKDLWGESSIERKASASELWPNENSNMVSTSEKPDNSHLWNENSNLTVGEEKVDETNSEFLDSLLAVPNSNEFLDGNSAGNFLAENMAFDEKPAVKIKSNDTAEEKEKKKWREEDEEEGDDEGSYMRVWNQSKNPSWQKEESVLSGTIQPGVRTAARLTSTPESNGNVSFAISNRRNSISDFSNISLESNNLDVVLPSAKTLIKDCLKGEELKPTPFLEGADNFKVKNWGNDPGKAAFNTANVNSEDLMKMALESLTSQHDVINVPPSGFDSTIGILNQNQENLFAGGEPDADALDFNLPLPDHLLRANFAPCEQAEGNGFQNAGSSSSFLTSTNNIFDSTCALPNPIKFDEQFGTNFQSKKSSKSLDDVIEFLDGKTSFSGFDTETDPGNNNGDLNPFPFASNSHDDGYGRPPAKKKKGREKKGGIDGRERRVRRPTKKGKNKKAVDYPKGNSIESIINEALFDSCSSVSKPSALQINHSSPNSNAAMTSSTGNYTLPIISGTLDEVENLDFLSQD